MNKEQAMAFLMETLNDYIRSLPPSAGKAVMGQAQAVFKFLEQELTIRPKDEA